MNDCFGLLAVTRYDQIEGQFRAVSDDRCDPLGVRPAALVQVRFAPYVAVGPNAHRRLLP